MIRAQSDQSDESGPGPEAYVQFRCENSRDLYGKPLQERSGKLRLYGVSITYCTCEVAVKYKLRYPAVPSIFQGGDRSVLQTTYRCSNTKDLIHNLTFTFVFGHLVNLKQCYCSTLAENQLDLTTRRVFIADDVLSVLPVSDLYQEYVIRIF